MKCTQRHEQNGEQCVLEAGHEGNHQLKSKHRCHAVACSKSVPPRMLMCKKHWSMVPKPVQREVWATYREGQCDDKSPSRSWHHAADLAIVHVAVLEGVTLTGRLAKIAWALVEEAKQPKTVAPLPEELLL